MQIPISTLCVHLLCCLDTSIRNWYKTKNNDCIDINKCWYACFEIIFVRTGAAFCARAVPSHGDQNGCHPGVCVCMACCSVMTFWHAAVRCSVLRCLCMPILGTCVRTWHDSFVSVVWHSHMFGTLTNVSHHIYEHMTPRNEYTQVCAWHDLFVCGVSQSCVVTLTYESNHAARIDAQDCDVYIYNSATSRAWISHVTHMNQFCHPHEWGVSRIYTEVPRIVMQTK